MKSVLMGISLFALISVSFGANQVWDITPLDPTIFGGGYTESVGWSINNNRQIIGEVWMVVDGVMIGHIPAVWDFSDPTGWGVSHTMVAEDESMYLKLPRFEEINDSGQVCGNYLYCYPGEEEHWAFFQRPMVYNIYNRSIRDLGCLGDDEDDKPFLDFYNECYWGNGFGINNAGTIIGFSSAGGYNVWGLRDVGPTEPTAWMGGGEPMSVTAAGYDGGWPKKINNNNLMIGVNAVPLGAPEQAFKQTGLSRTTLPLPAGREGWASCANNLNDQDMIVGYIWGYEHEGVLWHSDPDIGIVQLPDYPGGSWSSPLAINNQGMIVGQSDNGAVVWIGAGNNYQIVSLNMFAAQTGWVLYSADDINEEGWIVGRGSFNGHDMGFLARSRLDENPPIANLDSNDVQNEDGQITIGVLYYDDNGMNTATMDNEDIQVIYPDGTNVMAEFKSVEELEPEPETGKRKYRARYSISSVPLNPMIPGSLIIQVEVAQSEVSDMSGRYVPKGWIGELEMTFPAATATILKGSIRNAETSTTTWKFETHLYTVPVNPIVEILEVKFQSPDSSSWQTMTSSGDGDWKYVQTAATSAGLSAFGDGEYIYRVSGNFDGPFEEEVVFIFGEDSEGDSIAAPVSSPIITSPLQGQTVSHKNIKLSWQQPADPAISSILCSITDVTDGSNVFTKVITGGTASSAGTITLQPDRNYEMTVHFCSGDQSYPEEDDWISYKLKYTSTKVSFFTQQYVGDINDDDIVDMTDLSLLSTCWKKTSSQAGWNAQYDLQPNGAIDLGDLFMMAENWLK